MVEQIGYSVVIEAHLDRFDREMRDAGRVVETVAAGMDKSTKRAAQSFNALEAALDPVARATQRYERDVARVKRAIDSGAVSQERAANVLERLHQQYSRATAVNDNFGVATGRTAIMSGRMGNAVQQAGFQVGDFAVQIASGQNPLRAFIQQGTQMVSMFGPWGAVIGAAGAVIGALATSFIDAKDEVEKATDNIDEFSLATENMSRLVGGGEQSLDGLTEAYRRLSMAQREVERTALSTQRDTFVKQMEDAARASRSTIGGILPTALGSYQAEFREARETLLQIKDVAQDRGQIIENVRVAIDTLRNAGRIEDAQQLLTDLREFEEASKALDHIELRIGTLKRSAQGIFIPENSLSTGSASNANALFFQNIETAVDATRDSIERYKSVLLEFGSPADAYGRRIEELARLQREGLISAEQFSKAQREAAAAIVAAAEMTQGKNSLTTGGSSTANQAYFERVAADNASSLADQQKRVAEATKLLNQQIAIAKNLYQASLSPTEEYEANVNAIAAAEAAGRITTEQATAARRQAMNVFVESDPVLSSMADGLRDVGRSMIDLGGDAGSMGERVAAAFERMAERILQAAFEMQVVNPIINSLFGAGYATSSGSGGGGGIFGSLIGAAASYFGGGGYTTTSVGTIHTGGLAGEGRGITRNVSPALFLGADRFHDGGIPGLRNNEVPAILENDEEVLTVQDPRHRFNMGKPANDRTANPITMIFNNPTRDMIPEIVERVRELGVEVRRIDRSIEPRSVEANVSARQREPRLFGRRG